MTTPILRERIGTLTLRLNAPFPSQLSDTREMIKEHQRANRLRLVPRGLDADAGGCANCCDDCDCEE